LGWVPSLPAPKPCPEQGGLTTSAWTNGRGIEEQRIGHTSVTQPGEVSMYIGIGTLILILILLVILL
jgi:hypothetical protein